MKTIKISPDNKKAIEFIHANFQRQPDLDAVAKKCLKK